MSHVFTEVTKAVSKTNCFWKMGGLPKWQAPKYSNAKIFKNQKITRSDVCRVFGIPFLAGGLGAKVS